MPLMATEACSSQDPLTIIYRIRSTTFVTCKWWATLHYQIYWLDISAVDLHRGPFTFSVRGYHDRSIHVLLPSQKSYSGYKVNYFKPCRTGVYLFDSTIRIIDTLTLWTIRNGSMTRYNLDTIEPWSYPDAAFLTVLLPSHHWSAWASCNFSAKFSYWNITVVGYAWQPHIPGSSLRCSEM